MTNSVGRITLREELARYVSRNDWLAIAVATFDCLVLLSAGVTTAVVDSIWVRLPASIVVGTATSALFVLGHDAAHANLTSKVWLNKWLSRLFFFPSLHNCTLWLIEHNRLHHLQPNISGVNSWSPLSYNAYRSLPWWRKLLERIYRSGAGFGVYYLAERWWRSKFIPKRDVDPQLRLRAWADFVFLVVLLTAWVGTLIWLNNRFGAAMPGSAVFWGFAFPFLIWNHLIGLTIFLHHTHPDVPWFSSARDAKGTEGQEFLSIKVHYPRWYRWISHNIMEHPAHHVNPLIPWYRLQAAQERLIELLGSRAHTERFSIRYLLMLVRTCKLYDYDMHEWLDFSGRPVSRSFSSSSKDVESSARTPA